jgi:hypothetical protein
LGWIILKEIKQNDPYLVPRIPIGKNMDHAYLLEVKGLCPRCGKYLLAAKGSNMNKLYQIAHIYPNKPLPKEVIELDGLERLGVNCEDFANKIALCKVCHGYYDDHKTKDEYLDLLEIKKSLLRLSKARIASSHQDIEDEIVLVINALAKIDVSKLEKIKLEYKALRISNKVEDKYLILKNKIELYVCTYFNFVKETFQCLEQAEQINFEMIASEIKVTFFKCEKETQNKSEIFLSLVNWLKSKIAGVSFESCEVLISYFVQNCEVFHEITE